MNSLRDKLHPSRIDLDSEQPDRALESSPKVKLNEQDKLIMKMFNKRYRNDPVDQIDEHSKENDNN